MVAIVFLLLKRKPEKVRVNLKLVNDILEKSTRMNLRLKQTFNQILQLFTVLT